MPRRNGQVDQTVEEIARNIAAERAALAQTMSELAAKADVRGRVAERAEAVTSRVAGNVGAVKERALGFTTRAADQTTATATSVGRQVRRDPVPALVAAGVVALAVAIIVRRRGGWAGFSARRVRAAPRMRSRGSWRR